MRTDGNREEMTIRWGQSIIRIRSSHSDSLNWLLEFLAPAFELSGGEPDLVVRFEAGPEVFSAWSAQAQARSGATECFTLDAGRDLWSRAEDASGAQWVYDDRKQVAMHVARNKVPLEVHIVAATEQPHGRAELMRTVREFASRAAVASGDLPIHASAVLAADGITLFSGRKRAGKSTLLLYAIMCGSARFVSNDRVFLHSSAREIEGIAMPSITRFRAETLTAHPELEAQLQSGAWHYPVSVDACKIHRDAGTRVSPGSRHSIAGISPTQFCALIGVEAAAKGMVARIVFPNLDSSFTETPGFQIERLSVEQTAKRLGMEGLIAGGRSSPWLSPLREMGTEVATESPPQIEKEKLERQVAVFAENIPGYACTLGPRPYDSPALWKAIGQTAAATPRQP